ncbi:MAG TPA: HepT-like ribonuclease domain-containing protein [Bryobacteraceae bacterium]|nr:HepT-like ribonuclease domain-containing protein [Bryobacteraceae bacterium]
MRSDADRLQDLLEAIERIERHAARGKDAFYQDELLQTWILHHLLIIGEACRALSQEFRTAHQDEIWADASGLRNVIVHHYFGVDREVVWGVVERDLPELKRLVKEIADSQT